MRSRIRNTKLHFISCKKCNKTYLVGVNNKSIIGIESGGKNFISFSIDELSNTQRLNKKKLPCNNCGNLCDIKVSVAK